jgi:transcriptional regulator with XRE-family HTH domain
MEFCEKIKELRKEKGATALTLSNEIGVERSTYSNYEQGIREPSYEILKRISKYFDVSIDYLLDDENEDFTNNREPQAPRKSAAPRQQSEIEQLYSKLPRDYQQELIGYAKGLIISAEREIKMNKRSV